VTATPGSAASSSASPRAPRLDLTDRPGPGYDPRGWSPSRRSALKPLNDRFGLAYLLLLTFALRAIRADQPIVENYVGRQIPTAMVARNLERGSGFGRPQLDTGPFPNLFLVEPPLFAAAAVGLRRLTGLALEPAGRLVSALATCFGAWGLFGLVRRREGAVVARLAVVAFAIAPITIRYGRAFQPDMLMIGCLIAGLRCWDEREAGGGWSWLAAAWSLTGVGLALKVISAYVLLPFIVVILRPRRPWKVVLGFSTLLPALIWYAHAWSLLSVGSRASADNAAIWSRSLGLSGWLNAGLYVEITRFLCVRGFTPLGFALAAWGLTRPNLNRLWLVWGAAAVVALGLIPGKVHHEYYWLALAPVVAVGVGRGIADVRSWTFAGSRLALGALLLLGVCSILQARSTWQTPREWRRLPLVPRMMAMGKVSTWDLVVAPEAVLYEADRRGCRLEADRRGAVRAAGEWGGTLPDDHPLALIEFYRSRRARYVVDVYDSEHDPRRDLHDAIRARYPILVDRSGVIFAELPGPGGPPNGRR
jgi:hypothetical protein